MAKGENHVTNRFSPELALVDRDLAEVLRAFLADPDDCLTRPARESGPPSLAIPLVEAEGIVPRTVTLVLEPELVPELVEAAPAIEPVAPPLPELVEAAPAIAQAEVAQPTTPTVLPSAPAPATTPRRPRDRARGRLLRRHGAHAVTWIVALAILAVPLLAYVPPSDSLRPRILEGDTSSDTPEATAPPSRPTRSAAPAKTATEARSEPEGGKTERGAGSTRPAARGTTVPSKAASVPRTSRKADGGSTSSKAPSAKRGAGSQSPSTSTSPSTSKTTEPTPPVVRQLGWDEVKDADLYNVVFVRDGKRVDRWVRANTLKLPKAPAGKARPTIEYRWYVYPLYRTQDGGFRFGRLLADGSVNVSGGPLTG